MISTSKLFSSLSIMVMLLFLISSTLLAQQYPVPFPSQQIFQIPYQIVRFSVLLIFQITMTYHHPTQHRPVHIFARE